ncbi:MAG: hypothetical protein EPO40_00510 [Myxococcaceae bacterium]|nr:MAG: hypothetical protein EPO40_00510 [Myxococcaceae bacterium]
MKTDLRSSLLLMVSAALGGGSLAGCASTPHAAPVAVTPAPGAMHGNGQAGSCGAMSTATPATPATANGQAASCGATGSCGAARPANPSGGGH